MRYDASSCLTLQGGRCKSTHSTLMKRSLGRPKTNANPALKMFFHKNIMLMLGVFLYAISIVEAASQANKIIGSWISSSGNEYNVGHVRTNNFNVTMEGRLYAIITYSPDENSYEYTHQKSNDSYEAKFTNPSTFVFTPDSSEDLVFWTRKCYAVGQQVEIAKLLCSFENKDYKYHKQVGTITQSIFCKRTNKKFWTVEFHQRMLGKNVSFPEECLRLIRIDVGVRAIIVDLTENPQHNGKTCVVTEINGKCIIKTTCDGQKYRSGPKDLKIIRQIQVGDHMEIFDVDHKEFNGQQVVILGPKEDSPGDWYIKIENGLLKSDCRHIASANLRFDSEKPSRVRRKNGNYTIKKGIEDNTSFPDLPEFDEISVDDTCTKPDNVFSVGTSLEVYSASNGGWVLGCIYEIINKDIIEIQYRQNIMYSKKVNIKSDLNKLYRLPMNGTLKFKDKVEVYSTSARNWYPGIIYEVKNDGSVEVQYRTSEGGVKQKNIVVKTSEHLRWPLDASGRRRLAEPATADARRSDIPAASSGSDTLPIGIVSILLLVLACAFLAHMWYRFSRIKPASEPEHDIECGRA